MKVWLNLLQQPSCASRSGTLLNYFFSWKKLIGKKKEKKRERERERGRGKTTYPVFDGPVRQANCMNVTPRLGSTLYKSPFHLPAAVYIKKKSLLERDPATL